VWEYSIKKQTKNNPHQMTNVKLIYSDDINDFTISKIINNFSTYTIEDKKTGPIFHMSSTKVFPVDETLLPMFKRRIAGLISQEKNY
jgi:hypothetical protein